MNNNKSNNRNSTENELELGKYLESDMIALTDDEVAGGATPTIVITVVTGYISTNTCPTTACTRAC
ncbi:class II lanthipeptide, LchA2/BrtA2 family [Halobacillus hunanensis]|uniref:class II lanthipeptide, LchA2/BrtA2 family n=1 Tax=Halobacillus hunanensis TaxID=578214 RepID=UPI0009A56681|nr:class II lanthipeptide, LchA2/BrtA2 family [Halobacillus hunanensis]